MNYITSFVCMDLFALTSSKNKYLFTCACEYVYVLYAYTASFSRENCICERECICNNCIRCLQIIKTGYANKIVSNQQRAR